MDEGGIDQLTSTRSGRLQMRLDADVRQKHPGADLRIILHKLFE
jgi:hypothetical protein